MLAPNVSASRNGHYCCVVVLAIHVVHMQFDRHTLVSMHLATRSKTVLRRIFAPLHTHIHIHTHIRTYTLLYVHSYAHNTHTLTHTHTHTYTHSHTHTHTHSHIHKLPHTQVIDMEYVVLNARRTLMILSRLFMRRESIPSNRPISRHISAASIPTLQTKGASA